MLAINGMPDHVHVLFGFRPSQSLADLMQDVKGSSSRRINEKTYQRKVFMAGLPVEGLAWFRVLMRQYGPQAGTGWRFFIP